jgi:hypothetical protein
MIKKALDFTRAALDQFLRNRFGLDESSVVLNNLIDSNGSIPLQNQNKIVISLINIEKETAKPFYVRNQKMPNGDFSDMNPAERFNLIILITAGFDDYNEALKFLNETILFFQINQMLDCTTFPSMPQGLSRLELEIEKITYHNMQSLWTAMGAKYQPSVIYKMRMITLQGDQSRAFINAVMQADAFVNE